MRRRDFLLATLPVGIALRGEQKEPKEWVTAAASRDTVPRVGLIPSTFTGGEEMDRRKIRGLAKPAPIGTPLSAAQLDDMLRLAVELGGGRRGGLVTAIGREDWVVLKVAARDCGNGSSTDPRLIAGVLRFLIERGFGKRFSIVEASPCRDAAWSPEIAALAKKHPVLRIELIDTATAPSLEMPVEGRVFASRNRSGVYRVPRVLRECDKVISIAPLATRSETGIALAMMNYLGFSPALPLAELGHPGEIAVDLFSFHPADYAIVGGSLAMEAGGVERRHNVIVAGTNAPAVDAVGAAVMGFEPAAIRHLELAVKQGYGLNDAGSIWTRGAEIGEVKADFRKPA